MTDFAKYCEDQGIDREKMTSIARDRLLYEISPEMRESCKKMIGMWLESYDRYEKEQKEIQKKTKTLFNHRKWEKRYETATLRKHEALSNALDWAVRCGWENDNVLEQKNIILARKSEYIEYYQRTTNPQYYEWKRLNEPYCGSNDLG